MVPNSRGAGQEHGLGSSVSVDIAFSPNDPWQHCKPPHFARTGKEAVFYLAEEPSGPSPFLSVVPDRFYRAPFHGLFTESPLFVGGGLDVNVGVSLVIISGEIFRGRLPTEIAVDALIVDVELPVHVVIVSVFEFCHFL